MCAYQVKLGSFEGPLDLLLQLIEKADLDVTEVALSEVTEQFMDYLELVEEKNPHELADFLVVASRLLLIKSRALLPEIEADEDEGILLEDQLKIYKEFFKASQNITKILADKKVLFAREKIPLKLESIFNPPQDLDKGKLKEVFEQILKKIEPVVELPKKSIQRAVSIKEKINLIRQRISEKVQLKFTDLIKDSQDRTEVVVAFLGILELVKTREVFVSQDKMFGEVYVSKNDKKEKSDK